MTLRLRTAATAALLVLGAGCAAGGAGGAADDAKDLPAASTAAAAPTDAGPAAATSAVPTSYVPEPGATTPTASEVRQVEGTTWAGTDPDGDYCSYRFESDGHLACTSPSGENDGPSNTWSQSGDQVTLLTSGGYSTRVGTIQGDGISGTASNVSGRSWTWTAQLQ